MATIRRRGDSWQAQIRRVGHSPQSRTFAKREDAQRWVRSIESGFDRQPLLEVRQQGNNPSLGDLLVRYEAEITARKCSNDRERNKIAVIKRSKLNDLRILDLKPKNIRDYRDDRLRKVKAATVKREIAIISHCISVAISEWEVELSRNPARGIIIRNADQARCRRLSRSEFDRLQAEINQSAVWYIKPIVTLALETGMRRGEILALRRCDLRLSVRQLHIPNSKNGHPRAIPLSLKALKAIEVSKYNDLIFPVNKSTLRQCWIGVLEKARISDFRFHDLRHEALSRLFELGLSISEISSISGHRTAQMLLRYTHARTEDIAMKLDCIEIDKNSRKNDRESVPSAPIGLK